VRTRHVNQLRNALREYYPAALEAFDDLDDRDTLAVLERAPDPVVGARLSVTQICSVLKRAGRQRNLDRRARQIQAALRSEQLTAPDPVATAFAASVKATVGILKEVNRQIEELEAKLAERFRQHPDADIYLSIPGLGDVLGARALGEFGDDPNRYADAKSRKNYAGTSPITIASGKKRKQSSPGMSETGGSTTPSTNGPSAHYKRVPDAASSTTNVGPLETSTTRRYEHSATDSSASSTDASNTRPSTTKTPPGHTARQHETKPPLDKMQPWGV
jgi:hypothetical protein